MNLKKTNNENGSKFNNHNPRMNPSGPTVNLFPERSTKMISSQQREKKWIEHDVGFLCTGIGI